MNFSSIIIKNIKYNIRNYLAYLIGNSIIETILFMFFTLFFSEEFMNSDDTMPVKGNLTEIVIFMALFSAVFIIYTTISYTKIRGKEFGVYFTIGLTTKEIIRILFFENMLILVISFLLSSLCGSLFSRLFHMGICKTLRITDIKIYINIKSFLAILAIAFLVCIFSTIYQYIFLRKYSIVAIFKAKTKKSIGMTGSVFGILGIILLFISLYIFNGAVYQKIDSRLMPTSILCVCAAIYLLLGFFMTFIVKIAKHFKGIYNNNILFLNSISYKFKSYRTILFVVTILVAMAMAFIGVAYSQYKNTRQIIEDKMPYDLSFIVKNKDINYKNIVEESLGTVKEYKLLEGINIPEIRIYEGEFKWRSSNLLVIKAHNYDENLELEDDKAIYVHPDKAGSFMGAGFVIDLKHKDFYGEDISREDLKCGNTEFVSFKSENIENRIESAVNYFYNKNYKRTSVLVVSDNVYEKMLNSLGKDKLTYEVQINLKNSESIKNLRDKLNDLSQNGIGDTITNKEEEFDNTITSNSFTLFIFVFLGIMFLAGSGAVLYFRTMTSIEEDKVSAEKLVRLGLTQKEIEKIYTKELLAVFFVPAVLALSITGYFLNTVYTVISEDNSLLRYTLVVFFVYIILQAIFYIITCHNYKASIRK